MTGLMATPMALIEILLMRSMIPHHSGAILMCREAQLEDPELRSLCDRIIESQQEEIVQIKSILSRLSR